MQMVHSFHCMNLGGFNFVVVDATVFNVSHNKLRLPTPEKQCFAQNVFESKICSFLTCEIKNCVLLDVCECEFINGFIHCL